MHNPDLSLLCRCKRYAVTSLDGKPLCAGCYLDARPPVPYLARVEQDAPAEVPRLHGARGSVPAMPLGSMPEPVEPSLQAVVYPPR